MHITDCVCVFLYVLRDEDSRGTYVDDRSKDGLKTPPGENQGLPC